MGGELEIIANPIEGLTLSGGLEVNKFDYQHGPLADAIPSPSPEVERPGETLEPQNVPKMTFNLSAAYTFPPTPLGTFEAQVDWFHSGGHEGSPNNASFIQVKKYGLLNGRLTLFDDERGLQYALFIRNALDREYFFSGVDFFQNNLGMGSRSWGEPRTYGVELTYRFGSDRG
jgi:iron complex outermembrane receptor protein